MGLNLRENLTFGFEQTFTIADWWTEAGFISSSDTPKKREMMLALAKELASELNGKYFESRDIWDHLQYEVTDSSNETQFFVTMDPGSIEVKTPPCLAADTIKMASPLFKAAERSGVLPYRNWWYGVRGGTEGGCHVNMGGFTHESNPLFCEPELVVKYAAYIHNRPFLHHPFMGVDVGPEGNAMRMDEKEGFELVQSAFENYIKIHQSNGSLSPQETYDHFAKTNLITEKSSYPSLYKFKTGLFLIEDRAQESLRCAEDFYLVSELRLKILEKLQKQKEVELLQSFPNLHKEDLTYFCSWSKFKDWAKELELPVEKYKSFFDRQFPDLLGGENVPKNFFLKDGRRPRIITDIKKRGDVIISKTIDSHYKRFEIYTPKDGFQIECEVEGTEEFSCAKQNSQGVTYHYLDLKYKESNPTMKIKLINNKEIVETGKFNIHNMMWE